jgi:hypothetical protein
MLSDTANAENIDSFRFGGACRPPIGLELQEPPGVEASYLGATLRSQMVRAP